MKHAWLGCLLAGSLLFAGTQDSETNVNTRYTVETVTIQGEGWSTNPATDRDQRLSMGLRREISALVGGKLNPPMLDELARRLRKELHARSVEHHVLRGKQPDYVQVVFDVKLRPARFDVSVPKFLYQGKQGWSGAIEGTASTRHNGFTLGLISDRDELVERYSGLEARYANDRLGTDRAHLAFEFDSFHEAWNDASVASLPAGTESEGASDLYRTRQNFQPTVSFVVARPVTVTVGVSFERLNEEGPLVRPAAANAFLANTSFHQETEGADYQQNFNGAYDLRMGTRSLGSDFAYARHRWQFRYTLKHGKHLLMDEATAGFIAGQAPLFERFALGNSTTLRGWNKYDIDPLGGNRMVHNSVEYRYGVLQVFYDAGAIWDNGQTVVARNSVGAGLRQGALSLALAFPLRGGKCYPIFMVGMNY
jgi:hypothetical protein